MRPGALRVPGSNGRRRRARRDPPGGDRPGGVRRGAGRGGGLHGRGGVPGEPLRRLPRRGGEPGAA
ncbi:MAG: hypothetical protein E6J70_06620, partial [Deltaproteobacteria bacterium]